jgi:hypothetical protein
MKTIRGLPAALSKPQRVRGHIGQRVDERDRRSCPRRRFSFRVLRQRPRALLQGLTGERASLHRFAISAMLGLAVLVSGQASRADEVSVEVSVDGGHCASKVRLAVSEAHLSEILKRLAQELDFQIRFESGDDPLVSIDTVREPNDLVAYLSRFENVSMTLVPDRRCANRQSILQVWVLPKAEESQAPAARPVPQALPPAEIPLHT